ncbi:MAG TPA: hypothetical protein VFX12_11005, partial [Vicinamibacterales bacterium]|nr:hypothetical protein [Vicinamibacterales bacterium]
MRKKQDLTPAPPDDPNIMAAGLLYDLALLQPAERSRFGYIRAAKTIATGIESSVRDLVGQGTLRDVPFVGPSSARIVTEFVETGHSSTVRDRLAASPARGEVERRRAFRRAYLSRHAMRAALAATAAPHVIGRETY